jgi:hypothetical protein
MLILQSHEEVEASVVEWQLHLASLEKEMLSIKVIVSFVETITFDAIRSPPASQHSQI